MHSKNLNKTSHYEETGGTRRNIDALSPKVEGLTYHQHLIFLGILIIIPRSIFQDIMSKARYTGSSAEHKGFSRLGTELINFKSFQVVD